ncbi:Solute carrier family 26 member 6 [Frankliniella fusca]|uniref:Solute carrier family 26 member 6 n=1 Tax=Frankliniella fusca TaxID=407009 RepID=A0AAE1HTK0_9NEOP|nr:Solute carrier family 26 member 6 [Frankliniella fusca]
MAPPLAGPAAGAASAPPQPPPGLQMHVTRPVFQQDELERTFGFGKKPRQPGRWRLREVLRARVPAVSWLASYQWRRDLPGDLVAGATVSIMHVPQGMAYALLGGVPPITGIHMAFYPVLVYALLGTSRHISVGTFAVVCLMTGSSVAAHADKYDSLEVASAVSFLVGCYLLIMAALRLGALSNLLSDPLVSGFSAGAAFHAFSSQLKDVIGVQLPGRRGAFNVPLAFYDLALAVPRTNLTALAVSAVAITVLSVNNEVVKVGARDEARITAACGVTLKPWVGKRCSLPIPIELVVVVVASLVGALTPLFDDVRNIGDIPTGLQVPRLPPLELLPLVAVDALTVAVVAYVIALSLALLFAGRGGYEVDANQELLALGAASLVGSLFACIPVSASPSRSSLQVSVGGRTQLASVVSCCGLLVVLLWAGPFFETLPRCVLASIILVALKPMLQQIADVVRFWRLSRLDGALWLLTFLTVVLVDLDVGLGTGVAASLAVLFAHAASPYTCALQPLPATNIYVDTRRYANTVPIRGVQILQFNGVLNFASQGHLKAAVRRLVPASDAVTHTLILDLGGVARVDPAGVGTLRGLQRALAVRGVSLLLAAANARVLAALRRCCGLLDAVALVAFPTVHDAVVHAETVTMS